MVFLMIALALVSAGPRPQDNIDNQVLVSFIDKTCDAFRLEEDGMSSVYPALNAHLERYRVEGITKLTHSSKGAKNIYLIEYPAGTNMENVIEDLRRLGEVKSVSLNRKLEFFAYPNDYYYNNDWLIFNAYDPFRWIDEWYLKCIQADKAWRITKGDPSVKIAIIDTGVDYFHPDLINNIWVNPSEDLDHDGVVWDIDDLDSLDSEADEDTLIDNLIGWDFDSQGDNNPYPDTASGTTTVRHGTMMSSFFSATDNDCQPSDTSIAGISWHCKLVHLKAGSSGAVVSALDHAIEIGVDVVNASIGLRDNTDAIEESVTKAYENGIVVVAADGEVSFYDYYPAACPEAIAVSTVDEDGSLRAVGFHDYVDVCGISGVPTAKHLIVTTIDMSGLDENDDPLRYPPPIFPGTQYPHAYFHQGASTSCSCAQVSAVAGLLKSMYPDSSPAYIRREILRGAVPTAMPAGRINPYRSLTQWGKIRNDTTWAAFAYVSADIQVDTGVTLTIEPGTTIYFATDDNDDMGVDTTRIALDVRGALIANGTAAHPIVFRSMSEEPLPGDWYGILFADESSSGSLTHCVIQDARYGVKSAVTVDIADCQISNCLTAGIYMYDDMDTNSVVNNHSTISNCYVWNNIDGAGIRIWNCPYAISVDSCTVTLNDCGIWVSNAAPVITASNINANYSRGIWVTSYQYPVPYPYPVIQWCHMQGNGEEGIKCEYNKAQISYSKSWENGTYGILAYGDDADPVIDHSKIIDNPAAGLRVDSYAYPVLGNATTGEGRYNSLYGQSQAKNVYNTTSQYIYAQNCWWGSNPPNVSKFYGRVTYQPYLTSDPVYYLAPLRPNTPTVLSLEQNFPNPFIGTAGATTLKYAIPSESDRVVLRIFDVSGRRVCTLVDRPHKPGFYSARWDGRNERGGTVAPGVYFCEMSVGKQSFTKKIVLFR